MPREMRISAVIPLPEGAFAEASAIVNMQDPIEAFAAAVRDAGGESACDVVTPKARTEKGGE